MPIFVKKKEVLKTVIYLEVFIYASFIWKRSPRFFGDTGWYPLYKPFNARYFTLFGKTNKRMGKIIPVKSTIKKSFVIIFGEYLEYKRGFLSNGTEYKTVCSSTGWIGINFQNSLRHHFSQNLHEDVLRSSKGIKTRICSDRNIEYREQYLTI